MISDINKENKVSKGKPNPYPASNQRAAGLSKRGTLSSYSFANVVMGHHNMDIRPKRKYHEIHSEQKIEVDKLEEEKKRASAATENF